MIKNYYQVLGLNIDSSKEDIKKAHRIYATKFHPDKQNGDNFFEERFKEIQEAYEILIDVNKRAVYDSKLNSASKKSYNFNSKYAEYNFSGKIEKDIKYYYTSELIQINSLYIEYKKSKYFLSEFTSASIRKNESPFNYTPIYWIILGILTIIFLIGIIFIWIGIVGLCANNTYYMTLIGKKGGVVLMKGKKPFMNEISLIINQAISENNIEIN